MKRIITLSILMLGLFLSSTAQAVTVHVPAGQTVSAGVCPDEGEITDIPSNVTTVKVANGPIHLRNTSDTDAVVIVHCSRTRALARPVSAYDAAADPHAAHVMRPGDVWYPPACKRGGYRYSDLSAYRSNGRSLGGQEWIQDDLGRRDHGLAWAGNIKRNPDAYVYYYARGWSDPQRPFFVNNTAGRIIAAAWCG